jgi:glutathione synthase
MPLRFVFIMDPISTLNIKGDSSFVLMLEAQKRGHQVLYAEPKRIELRGDDPWIRAEHVELQRVEGNHYTIRAEVEVRLNDVDAIFVRKDPPFDVDYLIQTYILDYVDRKRVVFVNDPQAVRDFNEKLSTHRFQRLMPKTVITADRARIRQLIAEMGSAVLKPLSLAGGSGVIHLIKGDRNTGSVVDLLTREGRSMIAVQEYLPEVIEGDKRIVLLDGRALGAVNRRPRSDDLRANMHIGGTPEHAVLTDRDREIIAAIGPELSRRGLVFVGIDVIGGRLTEINVTSPTGLQEIDRFDHVSLESDFIDWVEKKSAALVGARA